MSISGVTVDTNSLTTVISNLQQHQSRLKQAITILATAGAKKMEAWAKTNARWTDRTGNARQGLTGDAVWIDEKKISVVMSYSVNYGIWLELAHEKKYAILEESIEQNKDELIEAYRRLVG